MTLARYNLNFASKLFPKWNWFQKYHKYHIICRKYSDIYVKWYDISANPELIHVRICSYTYTTTTWNSTHISILIPDSFIKFFSLHDNEVVGRGNDSTLCSDRASRVNIVSSHHPNSDSSILTMYNGSWNLEEADKHGTLVTWLITPKCSNSCI